MSQQRETFLPWSGTVVHQAVSGHFQEQRGKLQAQCGHCFQLPLTSHATTIIILIHTVNHTCPLVAKGKLSANLTQLPGGVLEGTRLTDYANIKPFYKCGGVWDRWGGSPWQYNGRENTAFKNPIFCNSTAPYLCSSLRQNEFCGNKSN